MGGNSLQCICCLQARRQTAAHRAHHCAVLSLVCKIACSFWLFKCTAFHIVSRNDRVLPVEVELIFVFFPSLYSFDLKPETNLQDPNHGNWWLEFGSGELVGYWPSLLFSHLASHAHLDSSPWYPAFFFLAPLRAPRSTHLFRCPVAGASNDPSRSDA